MIENKNTHDTKYILGQFFTPIDVATQIVNSVDWTKYDLVVEPSCGEGVFINAVQQTADVRVVGYELDSDIYREVVQRCHSATDIHNLNFYDVVTLPISNRILFLGNPPYRTPAYSLGTHAAHLQTLSSTYGVQGNREEAIFFILHTIHLIQHLQFDSASIDYIVPAIILNGTTKTFESFQQFLYTQCFNVVISSIPNSFTGVSQDLVRLQADVCVQRQANSIHKKKHQPYIPYQQIFQKTYLGSVPCESILVSIVNEPLCNFQKRLIRLVHQTRHTEITLFKLLTYNNRAYLSILDKAIQGGKFDETASKKLDQIKEYLKDIRETVDLTIFEDGENFKPITGRNKELYYFRHPAIKRCGFVYELNPNPCPSFYFTGNPSHSSTDYSGFCDYDVLRNVSPGACRTVPLNDNMFTDTFLKYWEQNTSLPTTTILSYLQYIPTSNDYKRRKKHERRFYFGIPENFDEEFMAKGR